MGLRDMSRSAGLAERRYPSSVTSHSDRRAATPEPRTPGASVFNELEQLLPFVTKPIQYVGGEVNSVTKEWAGTDVRWALMYPDAYEVGAPNQGVQILYEVINERGDALAERTYAVWPDLEALMREHGVPQFTVDAHRAVGDFDLLGLSFSTELGYTNMLTALDLAAIPLLSADRDEQDPLVVAGGHAAFNPEPIADFIDAAVLGDGEEAVLLVTDIVRDWKEPAGRADEMGCFSSSPVPGQSTYRASTTSTTCPMGGSSGWLPIGRTCRGGSASTP